jgi:cytochrome c553
MKNTVIFIVFVLIVVGFLYSISGKRYPQIPADANHQNVTDIQACLACHGPGTQHPQKPTHPPKTECFECHKKKRSAKAQ